MRYLVTGGTGFIGTNLCLRLLSEGHEVVAVDDLSSSYERNLQVLENERFTFVRHDVVNPLPDLSSFDIIYNLACPASPERYQQDPVKTFRTSVWGAWNVLQYAGRTPVIHSSTSEIYGDPAVHPQKEDYRGNVSTTGPRACYDEGKRAAETLLTDYMRMHKTHVRIARIFNTYGPYMDPDDGRVVSNFIKQNISGKKITIYGSGKQTRSFCYVDDLVDGLRTLEQADDLPGPVNLGNPQERDLFSLLGEIEKITGIKSETEFLDLPVDDPRKRCPDISLAKKLGWIPRTSLPEGLAKTISYFKALL